MKNGYEDGWFIDFEDAARWFLESDAAQGKAIEIVDEDGMDECVLPTTAMTPEEITKRAAALRQVLEEVISEATAKC